MKTQSFIALAMLAVNVASASSLLINSSFESPSYGPESSSPNVYYEYNPQAAGWQFTPASTAGGSGITVLPSLWSYAFRAPEGEQVAFIQGSGASISQEISIPESGDYTLSFSDAGRENLSGNLNYEVRLSGISLGKFKTVTGQPFSRHSIDFKAASGLQTLEFVITETENNQVDNSVFIDDVALVPSGPAQPDTQPPVITIISPGSNEGPYLPPINLIGSIFDNSGIATASWSVNGLALNDLPLTNGQFNIQAVALDAGTNTITLIASDAAGNRSKTSIIVVAPSFDPSAFLLNVNFTAHLNPSFSVKEGPAAIGRATNDYWNVYSRDVSSMFDWRASGVVTNLLTADRAFSGINLSVDNASGAWFNNSLDPMMRSYLYPGQGNIAIEMTNIPSGAYDLYVYAHGQLDTENAIIDISMNGVLLAEKATSGDPGWDPGFWQNGKQFVIFRSVTIASNTAIELTVKGGSGHQAVINGLQLVSPAAAQVDMQPPVVTITSPVPGKTNLKGIDLAGSAVDNTGIVGAFWFLNNGAGNSLTISNGQFSVSAIVLIPGTNILQIVAIDAEGNQGTNSVQVFYAPPIFLTAGIGVAQEGADLTIPITLNSTGDVSGITFSLGYDAGLLEISPDRMAGFANAIISLNTNLTGQLRASVALPGQALPGDGSVLASVTFRARSAATNRTSALVLSLAGLFDTSGSQIASDFGAQSGMATVTRRHIIGDNNGNNRLDVGDASLLMRFVTGLDPIRSWDISGNDLNSNSQLDSGDVVKILRVVVGLDPDPTEPSGIPIRPLAKIASYESAFQLSSSEQSISAGDVVNVRLELSRNQLFLSGASFFLQYPTNALRLMNAQSMHTGSMVPQSAAVLWNIFPVQNDYAVQAGMIGGAISSPLSWGATNGPIAEFAFQVQPGASGALTWPITVHSGEISTGFEVQPVAAAQLLLQGRAAVPLAFVSLDSTSVQLRIEGEIGKTYELDYSNDLKTWTPVPGGTATLSSGSATISDTNNAGADYRFYRISEIAR